MTPHMIFNFPEYTVR